jgi:large subunit ribosomal protein L4
VKILAYKSVLSYKNVKNAIMVIEDFNVESGKTKDFLSATKSILDKDKTSFILTDKDVLLKRASRNLPSVSLLTYNRLNVHDLFYSKKILITESAILGLNDMFENKKAVEVGVK